MIEYIRNHIINRFSQAEIILFPFPHLIIENIFPDDIYSIIIRNNPFDHISGKEWINKKLSSKSKTGTPYYLRKQINLLVGNSQWDKLDPFWQDLSNTLQEDYWFEKIVVNKYYDYFAIRFGEYINHKDFYANMKRLTFLQKHDIGYHIGPHTDIPTRVFTAIFAFAHDKNYEESGTNLCAPKDPLIRCWGNNHYSDTNFVIRKVSPFKPNILFIFFKTRQSFHSVSKIDKEISGNRFGMQYQFIEPSMGLFNDLSEPKLMHTRHKKINIIKKLLFIQ